MRFSASAPAKAILFGEHAVVYGYPALAVPVSALRVRAVAETYPSGHGLEIISLQAHERHWLRSLKPAIELEPPLVQVVRSAIESLDIGLPDAAITVDSSIPIASGLGSGAAVATAIVRVIALLGDVDLDVEQANEVVYEIEKIFHGTPSGIDNTVIVHELPVQFQRGHALEKLKLSSPIYLLIADTGKPSHTGPAVEDVRRLVTSHPNSFHPILKSVGDIVLKARMALDSGDMLALGYLMQENHELLRQLTVSSIELDNLVFAAMKSGAIGAKMSGGGRGGNLIALIEPSTESAVERGLMAAGATHVIPTVVS